MDKVMEVLSNMLNNIKYTIGLVVGVLYMLYDMFLMKTNIAGSAAVMQLEDSDVAYATGMNLATSGITSWVFATAFAVSVYSFIKLFLTTKEKVKDED